jgi:hypothetical protein
LQAETFNTLSGYQNKVAGECFESVLEAIIDEFRVVESDPRVKNKLKLAKLLPFTDTPEEGEALVRAVLS